MKFKRNEHKLLLIFAAITMGITYPSNVIPQSLNRTKLNEINIYSNKSFVTKAVEKTGSSVVTIDTQRYVKTENFQETLSCF